MPIYEYLCGECNHVLDALQKVSDDPLVYCPECGAPALKRQLSAPRFRLKGSGWYETDFKSDKRRNIAEADSKSAEKAESKSDKAADKPDKPAGKADQPAAEAKKSDSGAVKKPGTGTAGGVA